MLAAQAGARVLLALNHDFECLCDVSISTAIVAPVMLLADSINVHPTELACLMD